MAAFPISRNHLFYGALSLCGTLLSIGVGIAWNRLDAHEKVINDVVGDQREMKAEMGARHELDVEMRADVKEIRDAVRRLEGLSASRHAD